MARVAVVGLGAMGSGMAAALCTALGPVVVHNRSAAKARPLVSAGARLAASAAQAGKAADVVLLSLSDEAAVEEVLFGEIVPELPPGRTVVDTTTVSPGYARDAAARLAERGIRRVEACVLGNPQMAAAGRLRIFTAGEESDVDGVRDVLSALGGQCRHLGAPGRASGLKLAFNLLLGVQTAALAEAVALAQSAGIEREQVLDAIDDSGWRSPVLAFRAGFMRRRGYRPAGFRADLMRKDLALAHAQAAAHRLCLPLAETAVLRFTDVVDAGRGDEDAAVIVEVPRP